MHLSRESIRSLRTGAVGILALVAVWWLAALTVLSGARVPTPDGVLTTAVEDGWGFWSLHNYGLSDAELQRVREHAAHRVQLAALDPLS